MAMLDDVKLALGISPDVNDFDAIINATIQTGYRELETLGVRIVNGDVMVDNAVLNFVLSELDTPNKELYASAFAFKADKLRHLGEYQR